MADTASDTDLLRQFILGLAEWMVAAEDSVDRVDSTLQAVVRAYGGDDFEIVVLPTFILASSATGGVERLALRSTRPGGVRFDQIAALYELIERAKTASLTPREGIEQLNAIGSLKARHGWPIRVLGHGILTVGLALQLVPTWQGALIAFGIGLLIGLAKLIRSPTLQLVFPVVAAFASGLIVLALAPLVPVGDPLRLMIAPLVTLLPGGVLTTATMELASRQMIAGSARLVTGFVQLGLLAFGILAASGAAGITREGYAALASTATLPLWVGVLGVLLFAVGIYLHFSAPGRSFGWILLVLAVAYLAQLAGSALAGPVAGGLLGGAAIAPIVMWISTLKHGAPTQLTFLPAFWLLVPGAAGLVGLTEAIGGDAGAADFIDALVSILAIALGILLGTALYQFARQGAHELAGIHIDLPEPAEVVQPRHWSRLLPGTPNSVWRRRGQT